jgi:hypothetical protein
MKNVFISFSVSIFVIIFFLAAFAVGQPAVSQPTGPKLPIDLYLYARITDHVNLGITEDRIHRVLTMVDQYRRAHPDEHVSATLLFSGVVSDALERSNSRTHIVDFVKGYIDRGVIQAGYDGTDEPTYETRPTVDYTQGLDPQARFVARKASLEKFLTEARNPLSGAPEPGKVGGLKKMQEVFGEAACITGVTALMRVGPGSAVFRPVTRARVADEGPKHVPLPPGLEPEISGDSEAVQVLRTFNAKAIMFGLPDEQPSRIPGFRDARAGFSKLLSPVADTSPELYWQDSVLRSSEASSDVLRLVHAAGGVAAIQKIVEKADRTKLHVVHVELGDERNYLQPAFISGPEFSAMQYAYHHPDSPELPADALRPKSDVDAAYANEDAMLKWASETFVPANPGSRFVSSADLSGMVAPATGFSVSLAGLKTGLTEFLKSWGNDTFAPPLFQADGHYLSRAELFQVLADALAEYHRSGKLPESVQVAQVYGPVRLLTGHGPNEGEVSVAALATICADIAPALHDQSAGIVPKNALPIGIPVEGTVINPAQFLRLMAAAVVNPVPEAKLNIRMTYEFTGPGQLIPRTRPDMDDGFIWTLKPAQIAANIGR